MLIEIKKSLF